MHRIPVRSTKADAKRAMLAQMRQLTGDPNLSWKKAQKMAAALLREHRAQERRNATVEVDMSQFGAEVADTSEPPIPTYMKPLPWWRRALRRMAA